MELPPSHELDRETGHQLFADALFKLVIARRAQAVQVVTNAEQTIADRFPPWPEERRQNVKGTSQSTNWMPPHPQAPFVLREEPLLQELIRGEDRAAFQYSFTEWIRVHEHMLERRYPGRKNSFTRAGYIIGRMITGLIETDYAGDEVDKGYELMATEDSRPALHVYDTDAFYRFIWTVPQGGEYSARAIWCLAEIQRYL